VQDPEYLKFVVEELRALDLKLGEETKLREQLKLLSNQNELQELSAEALAAVDREELGLESLAAQLRKFAERAERLGVVNEQLTSMGYALEDLVRDLRGHWQDLVDQLDTNPMELSAVEERLLAIDRIQRKHQCPDDTALLAHWESLERRLKVWSEGAAELDRARDDVRRATQEVHNAGDRLNEILMRAEPSMVKAVTDGLSDLAMAQTRLAVRSVRRTAPGPLGTHAYTLEFSANPGQDLQDLSKVASGGERSRLMLVLKRYLADRKGLSTVLFDEIDTGVSGATASKMAQMLRSMSLNAQIIAITHLPQVAALGAQHWVVEKVVDGDRALTHIKTLNASQRPAEVARLLSDGDLSALAMAQAEALMAAAE
jgi:DNA repair protein RecN (Recombination protein N)